MFIENCSDIFLFFQQHYIFLYITIFIWEVRFTCFPKWFRITISTKFLKVLQIGLFIQIFQQVLLSLKLDNVTRIFLLKWGFWFSCKFFVSLEACLSKIGTNLKPACVLIADIHAIKNIQFKLVTIILFEIAVYRFLWFKLFKFCFENSIYSI